MSSRTSAEGEPARLSKAEVFFGQATPAEARVYVRVPRPQAGENLQLVGNIVGPECRFAQTLPVSIQLRDRGPGPSLLAEALLPDPCCWTPELPFVYRANVELRRDGQIIQQHEQLFGVRRLGVRGRDLFLEGKRWVLRAVRQEHVQEIDAAAWREASAAMVASCPSDELCEQMSLAGVFLVAELHGTANTLAADLARLARWPAVGVALLNPTTPLGPEIRRRAPNLVLAARCFVDDLNSAEWAHVIYWDAATFADVEQLFNTTDKPIIIERPLPDFAKIEEARAECDRLQAALAGVGDFAGYVV